MLKLSSHLKKHHIYHLVLFKSSDLNCNVALSECALGGAAAIIKKRFVAERTHAERKRRKLLFHSLLGFGWKKGTVIKSRAETIDRGVLLELKTQLFGRRETRALELCLDVGTAGHSEAFISCCVTAAVRFKSPEALCLPSIPEM